MKIVFIMDKGSGREVIAELTSDFRWRGNPRAVQSIRKNLEYRNVNHKTPEGWDRILTLFSGGIMWAKIVDDKWTLTK